MPIVQASLRDLVLQQTQANRRVGILCIDEDDQTPDNDPYRQRQRDFLSWANKTLRPTGDCVFWFFQMTNDMDAWGKSRFCPAWEKSPRTPDCLRRAVTAREDIVKSDESAFRGTNLTQKLLANQIGCLVAIGAYHQSCIRRTLEDAHNDPRLANLTLLSSRQLVRGGINGNDAWIHPLHRLSYCEQV